MGLYKKDRLSTLIKLDLKQKTDFACSNYTLSQN